MSTQGALGLLSNDLRDRIDAAKAELAALQAAVAQWRAESGQETGAAIPFAYGRAQSLVETLRSLLADLVALDDDEMTELIWRLRQGIRGTAALLVRSERLLPTLERSAADFADTGGRLELAELPHRKVQNYMVRDGDTPHSIMQRVTGDAERWIELVLLNSLDAPYITDDSTTDLEHSAVGTATFTHEVAQGSNYTIPAGTLIETVPSGGNPPVQFVTLADATIPAGQLSVEVAVEAVVPGSGGNVGPQRARIVRTTASTVDYAYTLQVMCSDVACNEATGSRTFTHRAYPRVTISQTCGGSKLNVKFPGELIYVPVNETTPGGTPSILQRANQDRMDALYGVDYYFTVDGKLRRDQTGDIRVSRGLENLGIALRNRVMIPINDLTLHPEYGCEIHSLIGQLDGPPIDEEIDMLIRMATNADPRVKDTTVTVDSIAGDEIRATVKWEADPTRDTGVETLVVQR